MSLLLCHECYSWITPADGRCPECQLIVDESAPDPPLHALRSAIGDVVGPLGEVRVRRKLLPEYGMLYTTTNGLYFLPHRLEQETRMESRPSAGEPLIWSLATLAWSPLALVLPLVSQRKKQPVQVPVLRPLFLCQADSQRLPQLLMENPGVFFLRRQAIRGWKRRRNHWTIARDQGPALKLTPESDHQAFHRRLSQLAEGDRWPDGEIDLEFSSTSGEL